MHVLLCRLSDIPSPASKNRSGVIMAALIRVLCVDDEPSVLMLQEKMLEGAGFKVLTATSGPEAIRLFESSRVDLVVMDFWMAGMNGITTAEKMKKAKPEIPIVFLSAYSELPGETVGLAECWIKKGEKEPEQLLALLQTLVNERTNTSRPARLRHAS